MQKTQRWATRRLSGFSYDANGNTVSAAGIANTYDFENHMLSHGAVTMVYDGDGNRVSETVGGTTTKYLVDTVNPTGYAQVIDELVSGAVTRTYAYGLQRISENQKIGATQTASFYGYDGHGNVRFLTGAAGTATDTYVYDAFGLPLTSTGTTPNNYLYGGEQFDTALGMYYLRARYYDPATGRFLAMDPYWGNILDPATLHKYIYTSNNPVNAADPTGRDAVAEYVFTWKLETNLLKADERLSYGEFGYDLLGNFLIAKDIGSCDVKGLDLAVNALASVGGGPGVAPNSSTNPSEQFPGCIAKALWGVLQPWPGIPFPPYPGP